MTRVLILQDSGINESLALTWPKKSLTGPFRRCFLAIPEAQTKGVDLQQPGPEAVPTRDDLVHHSPLASCE